MLPFHYKHKHYSLIFLHFFFPSCFVSKGFQQDHIKQIFRVVGAVLHFGNVEIAPGEHESSKIEVRIGSNLKSKKKEKKKEDLLH